MSGRKKISKGWIYIPLYLVLLIGSVWFFYDSLSFSTPQKPNPVAQPKVVDPGASKTASESIASCLEASRSKIGGSLKLFPTASLDQAMKSAKAECEGKLCETLKSVAEGKITSNDFFSLAKTEDPCAQKLVKSSTSYHLAQLKSRSVHGIFYQLGQHELLTSQLKEIKAFLSSSASAQNDGLLIIGRCGSVGASPENKDLALRRAEYLIEKIKINFSRTAITNYTFFGEEHIPLTFELADELQIPHSAFRNISLGSQNDPDFSIRLSQSILLVPYSLAEDPYGLSQ